MNKQHKRALLGIAAASALSLGVASNAYAEAYAVGYANFLNGLVSITGAVSIDGGANTSESAATLTGSPAAGFADIGPLGYLADATPSCLGSAIPCTDNAFTPIGITSTSYSRGDSVFNSDQFNGGSINVQNIAESDVVSFDQATALGSNSSQTQITFTVGLGGGTVGLSFDADPYLYAYMDTKALLAQASLSFHVTITDKTTGLDVFTWSPDGQVTAAGVGGTVGGTETLDDANLNISKTVLTAGSDIYDPTGDASFTSDGGVGTASCFGSGTLCGYSAISNLLAAGTYTMTIAENKQTRVTSVPEPETLALLGLGLAGIGFMGRRKKSA